MIRVGTVRGSAAPALLTLTLLVNACSGAPSPAVPETSLETEAIPEAGAAATEGLERWSGLEPEDLETQRLVTFNYKGPEGDGTLRLALRLRDSDRFSVQGTDRLGRRWFRIAADDDRALLLNFRDKTHCWFEGDVEILGVPLGPLSFSRLPALLLNRLPSVPLNPREMTEGHWEFEDRQGRRWTTRLVDDELDSWTLWKDGEPEVYWGREGELSFLSARFEDLQLRWRSSRSQPLQREPEALVVPEGFGAGECD
ncbi:MAG: hypothetical protein AAF690_00250 [Acidobacteriota bacterium]